MQKEVLCKDSEELNSDSYKSTDSKALEISYVSLIFVKCEFCFLYGTFLGNVRLVLMIVTISMNEKPSFKQITKSF